ncbi:iron-containing alcohol dehydrogenase [Bacillus sp. ISL-40]|uniref:iron-containing alcohol dehydrogenase n=1 Tax=unclassified Bacillus (in: firmicutes) TaxID=185979 RepID=UPI001BE5BBB0|nr:MULTISPECIES: iron-containing alcohol dehydrogenase [unclassified Bacillus (in: firmicutes)]MBT2696281.1 iron-containing alcohol dehydrogenase [Bacillus sp. ISL-40]MBT2720437.1 iron-containing alcohol dehydrogenase [Bacillus sp. ISL-46]MBT2743130.1 iron-containing alcohol dehydrogenase [Bacillus sp. ISL-77]
MKTTLSQFMLRTGIYCGSNSRAMVPSLFAGLGAKRVLLLSDRGLEAAGIVEKVADIFSLTGHGSGPELVGQFLDIKQDAESSCINEAVRYAREIGADSLLAVGGGSVLDTVKGVKYALHKGLTDIKEAIPGGLLYESFPKADYMPIPHIAIPTTAGTGSEVSPIAVIFNEEIQMKTNIINPFINADMAILDPDLTVGLPPVITAFTGFDALTHAIEALASPTATGLTDAYALHAIRLIEKNLPVAVVDGSNLDARMDLLQASLMGITAFSFALNAIPVHNMAHAYGALFRIPHGLANAVFLPVVMELVPELYLPKAAELAQALNVDVKGDTPQTALAKVIGKIKLLQYKVGLPADFKQFNISEEALQLAIPAVMKDPAALSFPMPKELIAAIGQKVVPLTVK